jgi:hypothetical protein
MSTLEETTINVVIIPAHYIAQFAVIHVNLIQLLLLVLAG